MKPSYRVGVARTAREMALVSHSLSKDGMTAYTRDKARWTWSDNFNVWFYQGPQQKKGARS
jgi:hypothetical protein